MKALALLITLSLSANVLLAAFWWKTRPARQELTETVVSESKTRADTSAVAKKKESSEPVEPAEAAVTAEKMTWAEIHSEDLKQFVQHLRAAGCPEETVQDVILAEVNRRYANRTREIWPERYEEQPFWKTQKRDPAENKRNRERWRQEREMQREKSALLVELLGVDPEAERRREDGMPDWTHWQDMRVSFLPESKREQMSRFLEDFEDKMQDFYARNQGLWDAESRAEQRQLEAERMRALAQILTPQELREYELRQSQLANQLGHDLRAMSLTRAEYEAIFDIRKKYGDSIYNYGDIESKEGRDQVEQNKKALQAEIAAALGPAKGKDYVRNQDYAYQQLTRLVRRQNLPAETASKVYDFKEAAEQSVKQLRDNKDLPQDKRQAALQQVRTETEQTLKETLGEQNYKRYLRDGGWWINNLAPAQRTNR